MPYINTNNPSSSAGVSQQINRSLNNQPTPKVVTPNLANPSISNVAKNFPDKQIITPSNMPQKTLTNPKLKEKMANKMK